MFYRLAAGLALLLLGAYIGRELRATRQTVRVRVVKKESEPRQPERPKAAAKAILH